MAQVTQLTVMGIPGRVQTFDAKTAADAVVSGYRPIFRPRRRFRIDPMDAIEEVLDVGFCRKFFLIALLIAGLLCVPIGLQAQTPQWCGVTGQPACSGPGGLLGQDDWLNAKLYVDAVKTGAIQFIFDGGGSAISADAEVHIEIPFGATITAARIGCEQTGSIVFDVWKDSYANFRPTVADTITASAKPTLSSADKSEDTSLTGWTTSISQGDWLVVHIDSASTVTLCTLSLSFTRN